MKKFTAALASIAFLALPGLAVAGGYYDYGYTYPSNYGYDQGYAYPQSNMYYSWGNPSMSVPEYGCGDHYQYTPCTYSTYQYQPQYQPQYQYQYQPYTTYNYPQNYYYPQTYMPQSYRPQQYYTPNMFNNLNMNTNTNTNINNIVNNNNSSATAIVYIPGYGIYRY